MLKSALHNQESGTRVAYIDSPAGALALVVDPVREFSVFQSATHITNTTTIMAVPKLNQSLRLVDLVLSGEKINGGTVTVRFVDGEANTENIYVGDVNDGPINLSWAPSGRVHGWANAWIEFITSTLNQDATCTIIYLHVSAERSLSYGAWNDKR